MPNQPVTMLHQRSRRAGFTLVEILIVLSIFILLVTGALVTYRTFSRRQQVLQSALNVQEALRFAQKKARVGEKPPGCQTLQGYSVRGTTSSQILSLYAECSNQDYLVSTLRLVGTAQLSQNITVVFQVISGGVSGTGNIDLNNASFSYRFTVNRGGEISPGDFL